MKANELMIGDWIWDVEDRKPYQMTPLMVCGLIEHKENEERVQPVPLTTEILEKNGFMDKGKVCYQEMAKGLLYARNENSYSISILFQNKAAVVMTTQYVHELQHALRLCGLTELTENFQV